MVMPTSLFPAMLNCTPWYLFENIEEKIEVLDPHVFHTKIINNEAELDGTPFVMP
jgi:hypothetical protein